jgi:hypothetical protein
VASRNKQAKFGAYQAVRSPSRSKHTYTHESNFNFTHSRYSGSYWLIPNYSTQQSLFSELLTYKMAAYRVYDPGFFSLTSGKKSFPIPREVRYWSLAAADA